MWRETKREWHFGHPRDLADQEREHRVTIKVHLKNPWWHRPRTGPDWEAQARHWTLNVCPISISLGQTPGGGASGPTIRTFSRHNSRFSVAVFDQFLGITLHRYFWRESRSQYLARSALWHKKVAALDTEAATQGCTEFKFTLPFRSQLEETVIAKDGTVQIAQFTGTSYCSSCKMHHHFTEETMQLVETRSPREGS